MTDNEKEENSLLFQEIVTDLLPPEGKRHKMEEDWKVEPHETADASGDGLVIPMIDNSKSPGQSDVFLEKPRKKEVTGAYKLSANSSSVEMDVEQTVASTSNLMNPIVEIDSSSDFEMDEKIRPLIHKVKFFEIILGFPMRLIPFAFKLGQRNCILHPKLYNYSWF